jgi:prophage antirepressor-like protein
MATIARRERSRSPVDIVAGASSSSGILRMLDMTKMQLSLDGRVSKVMYFSEDDIWFEAKPLVLYLEYSPTNVTQTLGIVKDKNKKSLKELLDTRGPAKLVYLSDKSPGYNDLKALYVNEPGLYSLIFRSTKKQAQDFQDWVYEDVLTALRRHGSYKIGGDQGDALRTWLDGDLQMVLKKRDDELQLALKARDDELQLALQKRDEAHMVQLEVLLGLRDDRVLQQLGRQCDRVVSAMQDSLRALIPNFSASLSQAVCFSLAQKFKDLRDDFRAAGPTSGATPRSTSAGF